MGLLPSIDHGELVKAQREDPAIGALIKLKETKEVLSNGDRQGANGPLRKLIHEWGKLHIRNCCADKLHNDSNSCDQQSTELWL